MVGRLGYRASSVPRQTLIEPPSECQIVELPCAAVCQRSRIIGRFRDSGIERQTATFDGICRILPSARHDLSSVRSLVQFLPHFLIWGRIQEGVQFDLLRYRRRWPAISTRVRRASSCSALGASVVGTELGITKSKPVCCFTISTVTP